MIFRRGITAWSPPPLYWLISIVIFSADSALQEGSFNSRSTATYQVNMQLAGVPYLLGTSNNNTNS